MARREPIPAITTQVTLTAMGQAKMRKQKIGDLYGTPEGSNRQERKLNEAKKLLPPELSAWIGGEWVADRDACAQELVNALDRAELNKDSGKWKDFIAGIESEHRDKEDQIARIMSVISKMT